jgi:ABC-2 type transport system ATP-binding protein
MSETTLAVRGLTKRYRAARALDDVTLDLRPGVTGLLGPNGAGKTTLLKILATVLSHDDGDVRVLGLDPSNAHQRIEIRRRLGYLPQDPGMYQGFTAFEMVDYVAVLKEHTDRRARHDEVRRVLALVDLEAQAHKKIRALSGGMRRRVALATALLGRPELLVFDEPTAGMDPEQRLRFREAVSSVDRDRTIVVSTHQTDDVVALCSRVIVLDRGAVCFDGSVAELAAVARGRVWLDERPADGARRAWLTGDGAYRIIGDPPRGATIVEPTIEDGYFLVTSRSSAVPA